MTWYWIIRDQHREFWQLSETPSRTLWPWCPDQGAVLTFKIKWFTFPHTVDSDNEVKMRVGIFTEEVSNVRCHWVLPQGREPGYSDWLVHDTHTEPMMVAVVQTRSSMALHMSSLIIILRGHVLMRVPLILMLTVPTATTRRLMASMVPTW